MFRAIIRAIREDSERVSHWAILATCFLSFFALAISCASYKNTEKWNDENAYVSIVQSRIETCISLSRHHYDIKSDSNIETDKNRRETTNRERGDKAAGMARALTLCLADHAEINGLKECVRDVNKHPSFQVHDILSSDGEKKLPTGKDNLIC